ncbi:ATP-binding protein, partial [Streptomyces sp. SAS_272]
VDVVVWDSDPTVPGARGADPGRVGQHGLEIVEAVSEELFMEQEPVGKRITARIALSDTEPGSRTAPGARKAAERSHGRPDGSPRRPRGRSRIRRGPLCGAECEVAGALTAVPVSEPRLW